MECVGYLSVCLVWSLVVGLVCAVTEGDVRLIDGYSNSNQGRVEVFHNGIWGTVCGQGWGAQEATVVCRQMNLGDVLLSKAFFGNGSGPILVGTHCHDHDFHINECDGVWEEVPTTCTHQEDVAVICYPVDHVEASTGLTAWNNMIIAIAMGVFCWLVYKMITFIEDSKVAGDEVSLHEVRTDDDPHAVSQHVNISDECDVSARKDDIMIHKHDATASKDDVTASNNGAATSKGEVTLGKNDVMTNKNDVVTNENDATVSKIDVTASKIDTTKIKNDTTANKDEVTASKDDVNNNDNYEIDERNISLNKSNVVQTSDVSVQTLK